LLIDDPLMEAVHTNLNEVRARHLVGRDVLVVKTKANMMTDAKETPEVTTKEPA
jgi:hypothetical protein